MPKLTLSADKDLIELAKRVAASQNTSVSAMVARMFRAVAHRSSGFEPLPPITAGASGLVSVRGDKSDRELIEDALTARYEESH